MTLSACTCATLAAYPCSRPSRRSNSPAAFRRARVTCGTTSAPMLSAIAPRASRGEHRLHGDRRGGEAGLYDACGEPLPSDFIWRFRTTPMNQPLQVLATNPLIARPTSTSSARSSSTSTTPSIRRPLTLSPDRQGQEGRRRRGHCLSHAGRPGAWSSRPPRPCTTATSTRSRSLAAPRASGARPAARWPTPSSSPSRPRPAVPPSRRRRRAGLWLRGLASRQGAVRRLRSPPRPRDGH